MSAPRKQSRFALLERRAGKDTIGIYTYLSQEHTSQLASSRYSDDESEENGWQLERVSQGVHVCLRSLKLTCPVIALLWKSFSVATNDAAQLAWSPDGRFIAVWENFLEVRFRNDCPLAGCAHTHISSCNSISYLSTPQQATCAQLFSSIQMERATR